MTGFYKIVAAAGLAALVSGCGLFGGKPREPSPDTRQLPESAQLTEHLSVVVTPEAQSGGRQPRFLAVFTLDSSWLEPGTETGRHSDRKLVSRQLKLNEPWKVAIPMGRGEFVGELTVFDAAGYQLDAQYWTLVGRAEPALDWWRQLTPAPGETQQLFTVTGSGLTSTLPGAQP